MTHEEKIARAVLDAFVDGEAALTVREISTRSGLSERTVRSAIASAHGAVLGTTYTQKTIKVVSRSYPGIADTQRRVDAWSPSDAALRAEIRRLRG
ncbi:MAG: hypothetical protein ACRCSL_16550 [Microbacterium sp.]